MDWINMDFGAPMPPKQTFEWRRATCHRYVVYWFTSLAQTKKHECWWWDQERIRIKKYTRTLWSL